MLANLTNALDLHSKALVVRAERQRLIASNIANADTPGYAGRDLDFKAAMRDAGGDNNLSLSLSAASGSTQSGLSNSRHIPLQASTASLGGSGSALGYTVQTQPSMDGNSIDMDRERASFADNAVRYEATLRFISAQSKTLLSAIQGQ
jgi:flagellar basal-body rod protein FlgB